MKAHTHQYLPLFIAVAVAAVIGCSDDNKTTVEPCHEPTLAASLCDPDVATFSLNSTNEYYPLKVGSEVILEGEEDGETIRVERRVLADTEEVAGVVTHVLEAKEFINDELYEVARNFYVEASDGTVCYFGEDVTFFENGEIKNHDGSWRADGGDAKPGIIMPAEPAVGQAYFQENAPGIALDQGRVEKIGETKTLGGEEYENVITIMDSNPMPSDPAETCVEEAKLYVPGIGEAGDTVKTLISHTPGS